jgi:hypothetical protein
MAFVAFKHRPMGHDRQLRRQNKPWIMRGVIRWAPGPVEFWIDSPGATAACRTNPAST